MPNPDIVVMRQGDTSKPNPFTIVIVANPVLEAARARVGETVQSIFVPDPITSARPAFDACAQHIDASLFGELPNQAEKMLGVSGIAEKVRVVSVFETGLPAVEANSLVANGNNSDLVEARRNFFKPFLAARGLDVDIAFGVTGSTTHKRASAYATSDDDTRPGVGFTLDDAPLMHRHFNVIPGAVAIHHETRTLTALHEFSHAMGSYSNGLVIDLYADIENVAGSVNNRRGRPIPPTFINYNGTAMAPDFIRDGLGYDSAWKTYHCELLDAGFPALMDNYHSAAGGASHRCQHDRITRQFLLDRVRAKINR
jgi:hypothetical protein